MFLVLISFLQNGQAKEREEQRPLRLKARTWQDLDAERLDLSHLRFLSRGFFVSHLDECRGRDSWSTFARRDHGSHSLPLSTLCPKSHEGNTQDKESAETSTQA